MTKQELLHWFDELEKSMQESGRFAAWSTSARSAIGAAFPPGHTVLQAWDDLTARIAEKNPIIGVSHLVVSNFQGIFSSAHDQLKAGRLDTLIQGVQAGTVSEILEQAEDLAASNYVVAATVLAGGALETHLLHLCDRANLPLPSPGSIEKYNNMIGQHRKSGNEIYSVNDGKSVTAWGGLRNEAAHDPGNFTRTPEEVRLMIEGIRQFIARVP